MNRITGLNPVANFNPFFTFTDKINTYLLVPSKKRGYKCSILRHIVTQKSGARCTVAGRNLS